LRKLKERPMSRDLVVSAWQPHIAQNPPTTKTYWAPCHCMFILNVQNEEVFQRRFTAISDDAGTIKVLGTVQATNQDGALAAAKAQFPDVPGLAVDPALQDDFEMTVAKSKRWNPKESKDGWLSEPMVPEAVRQRLCLHLTQRSCDIALGVVRCKPETREEARARVSRVVGQR
jgi:hypothetical protein